jgi:hypothetical protein
MTKTMTVNSKANKILKEITYLVNKSDMSEEAIKEEIYKILENSYGKENKKQ